MQYLLSRCSGRLDRMFVGNLLALLDGQIQAGWSGDLIGLMIGWVSLLLSSWIAVLRLLQLS